MHDHRTRRMIQALLAMSLLFGAAVARLGWLQSGAWRGHDAGASLARGAVSQRSDGFTVDSGRGQFTDRKGRLITGVPIRSMVAFPSYGMPRGSEQALAQAAKALGVSSAQLTSWLGGLKEPQAWGETKSSPAAALTDKQARIIERSGLLGVAVLSYRSRYPAAKSALHAIGYVYEDPRRKSRLYADKSVYRSNRAADLIGGSGLEKSLDRLLRGTGPTVVRQMTDAGRRPLNGLGLRTASPANPHYPLKVRTTLDLDIQLAAELAMSAAGVREGAAVVLDAIHGDILAMVSLPRLDPYRIGAEGTDERNHAVTAFAPGSVFKLVTLAAALESGTADMKTQFRCDGIYERYGLRCWKREGHGILTLEEALAESCNVVFAELAERMDPAWIQITAERLGLGRQIGWHADSFVDGKPLRLIEEEEHGAVFPNKKAAYDGGVRTGTGIGQRDVRITPLQAANLVVTLLHGGSVAAPRIVSGIRYADGGWIAKLPEQAAPSKYGAIKPETAAAVLEAMRSVVTGGTARSALASSAWPLAGKSGTAERGGREKARNDHWFVGYGPAKGTPRYAAAVLIENQPAGARNRAAALFGDVMERLRVMDAASRAPGTPETPRAAAPAATP